MKRILITTGACLLVLGAGCTSSGFQTLDSEQQASSPADISTLTEMPVPESAMDEESTSTDSTNDQEPVIDRSNLAFPGILPKEETNKRVRIKTNKGEILFEILPDEGPNAASNFAYLVKNRFYDGLTFHRVEPGFVIQGGDPAGNGTGGPGYAFEDDKVSLSYDRGIVAMANAGPNTNGSQFFIMLADTPLSPNYSIFGRVLEGMDVVDQIRIGDVMEVVTLEDKE